jgi:thiol-disulfide isomerase/thioredoxin
MLSQLKAADGATLADPKYQGKGYLVHFWAGWCPPCLVELPEWLEAVKGWSGNQVIGVAVSLDKSWADAGKYFPASMVPVNVISLLDPTLESSQEFGSFQFPETYLLNSKKEIVYKFVGGQNWKDPKLIEFVMKSINSP